MPNWLHRVAFWMALFSFSRYQQVATCATVNCWPHHWCGVTPVPAARNEEVSFSGFFRHKQYLNWSGRERAGRNRSGGNRRLVCPARGKSNYIELELFWNNDSDNPLLTHKTCSCSKDKTAKHGALSWKAWQQGNWRNEGKQGGRRSCKVFFSASVDRK